MNIGIDLRSLTENYRTGVGEYTTELLNAIFKIDRQNQYYLFYNSFKDVTARLPLWRLPNVHYAPSRWPNRLLNIGLLTLKRPRLDKLTTDHFKPEIDKLDAFFSPTLNYTSVSPNIKHILTVHDISFEFFPEYFTPKQKLWHKLLRPKQQCERADVILAVSENTKRDIVDKYGIKSEKIKIIYPGLSSVFNETPEQRTLHQSKLGAGQAISKEQVIIKYNLPEKFILFLGSIEPRKNLVGLIEAFEIYASTINNQESTINLVIAGAPGWKNKAVYERVVASKFKDKIKFIGYIKSEEKPALYSAASLFVYPSFYEGFGFPVLEAMNTGTPVITSNRSSLPEIAGSAAYLINPDKPTEIAEGIKIILNNPTLCKSFVDGGQTQAKKFTWENAAQEFLKIL